MEWLIGVTFVLLFASIVAIFLQHHRLDIASVKDEERMREVFRLNGLIDKIFEESKENRRKAEKAEAELSRIRKFVNDQSTPNASPEKFDRTTLPK